MANRRSSSAEGASGSAGSGRIGHQALKTQSGSDQVITLLMDRFPNFAGQPIGDLAGSRFVAAAPGQQQPSKLKARKVGAH